jgi:acetyltransferase-like isoleucine patch superfamily enzyme
LDWLKRKRRALLAALVTRWLKAQGVVVGKRFVSQIRPFVRLHPGSVISLGDDCAMHNGTGQNVAGVTHTTVLATTTSRARIEIGRNVGLSGAILVAAQSIQVEDDVRFGVNVRVYDNDFHPMDFHERMRDNQQATQCAPVVIGRGAWIGADALILKGVVIGDFAVVGARSVVTKSIPRCSVYAGNPARFIKQIPEPAELAPVRP